MRRRRFNAHLERNGLTFTRITLGYSWQDVNDHWERLGYTVIDVTSVPRRPRTVGAPPREKRQRTWEYDHGAIRRAMAAMGIDIPGLTFTSTWRGGRVRGRFEASPDGSTNIEVRAWVTPEQASRTLWHELAHAAQYARSSSFAAWSATDDFERRMRYGYRNRPSEIEAREWECLAKTDPLVREVS